MAVFAYRSAFYIRASTSVSLTVRRSREAFKHWPTGLGSGWVLVGIMTLPVFANATVRLATGVLGVTLIVLSSLKIDQGMRALFGVDPHIESQ